MGRRKVESVKPKKIKKNKKKKKILTVLLICLFIIVILAIIAFSIYYMFASEKLIAKNIKVENSEYYTEEQIIDVASTMKEKNMVFLRRSKYKKKILEELPYIEEVKLKIGKDSTLNVVVTERKAVYVANNRDTNEYVRIDKNGIMLEKVKAEDILPEEIPFFGLSLDKNEEVGKGIPETEFKKIERYEIIYKSFLEAEIESKITSVKFENSKIILTLDYKTEVVTEVFENIEYKMKFLKEILKEVSGKSGRIDLTLDDPTFVEKLG